MKKRVHSEAGFERSTICRRLKLPAPVIRCCESRAFLAGIGTAGEIVSTPSHSRDGVSLVLDDGDCLVGDLEPKEYLSAYADNPALKADWDTVMSFCPKRIPHSHVNEKAAQPHELPRNRRWFRGRIKMSFHIRRENGKLLQKT
jgi:hypothetical protein